MGTKELIREIEQLPVGDRMLVIERTLSSIRRKESKKKMEKAAEGLLSDYQNDSELTAFTDVDLDTFYEAV